MSIDSLLKGDNSINQHKDEGSGHEYGLNDILVILILLWELNNDVEYDNDDNQEIFNKLDIILISFVFEGGLEDKANEKVFIIG